MIKKVMEIESETSGSNISDDLFQTNDVLEVSKDTETGDIIFSVSTTDKVTGKPVRGATFKPIPIIQFVGDYEVTQI